MFDRPGGSPPKGMKVECIGAVGMIKLQSRRQVNQSTSVVVVVVELRPGERRSKLRAGPTSRLVVRASSPLPSFRFPSFAFEKISCHVNYCDGLSNSGWKCWSFLNRLATSTVHREVLSLRHGCVCRPRQSPVYMLVEAENDKCIPAYMPSKYIHPLI